MAKRHDWGACPEPRQLMKWFRRRVTNNMNSLLEQGKSIREHGFAVSEEQVNRKFHLLKPGWQPGEVLVKLQECGIPVVDRGAYPVQEEGVAHGRSFAISTRNQRSLGRSGDGAAERAGGPVLGDGGGDGGGVPGLPDGGGGEGRG